ncbi:multiple monosaccharide ABC transporter substrate-binding protein [Alloiococcus sp. CFN-8]|uniref:multiple monosaccharide ABC transporter substrate-binding protein n=1 Tax=Alloiococcus sp. CFN-8 TaxID=3416081 RepID=UPI003CF60EBA
MNKRLLSGIMTFALAAAVFTGCNNGDTDTPGKDAGSDKPLVGVSMPTKDLQRWVQDGENMEKQLKDAGYDVDLQYASNDVGTQVSQVENMIANGVNVLVISAIEGDSLGTVLAQAKEKDVTVIAYDRLLMNTDAVSYYATFDNYMVGTKQGEYIEEALDLENAAGPFNMEILTGDPGDNNAKFFYGGAMDVLQKYVDAGKLVVQSKQVKFDEVATAGWSTETAQNRMESILASYYADGTKLDVVLCSNDSTALGAINALESSYDGEWPVITGQDCDIANVKKMIEGKQSMSIFKDTRTLAGQVVKMIDAHLSDKEVEVNDTKTYDNGKLVVPSFLCEPVFADIDNYEELLVESGYYEADQLK